jgi:hypothetical protein
MPQLIRYTPKTNIATGADTHLERIVSKAVIRGADLSAKELGRVLDTPYRTVQNWLQGKSSYGIAVLVRLLVAFPWLQEQFNQLIERIRNAPDDRQLALPLGDTWQ